MLSRSNAFTMFVLPAILCGICGCSDSPESAPVADAGNTTTPTADDSGPADDSDEPVARDDSPSPRRGPVSLGGANEASSGGPTAAVPKSAEKSPESVMAALKPLQILMGQWEWKTQKTYGGFAAFDESEWVWDLLSDRERPALVMTTEKSPFFNSLRMTYDMTAKKYLLTAEHKEDGTRTFEGTFDEAPRDVSVDDDKKLQRTFELRFTEVGGDDKGELWRITFNQQRNDRYLVEMERKRGEAKFIRFDTVASQRQGTSFALADDDYGERTCIVSGGLGTSTVTFMGKTYYVCCSGCDAAFKDEPQRWIDKALADAMKDKE